MLADTERAVAHISADGRYWAKVNVYASAQLKEPSNCSTRKTGFKSTVNYKATCLPLKLTVPQLVKKFSAFHKTRRFITAFTRARRLSLSWEIQSILPPHLSKIHFNFIRSSTPGSTKWSSLPQVSPPKPSMHLFFPSYVRVITHTSSKYETVDSWHDVTLQKTCKCIEKQLCGQERYKLGGNHNNEIFT